MIKHGHTVGHEVTPTWLSWKSMVTRCTCETASDFDRYGGRGIAVCDRWLGEHGFENFLADMGERPEGRSLDRKDNDGNYTPENCQWATPTEQSRKRRRTARTGRIEPHEPAQIRWLRSCGYRLREIARHFDVSEATISRIVAGRSWA